MDTEDIENVLRNEKESIQKINKAIEENPDDIAAIIIAVIIVVSGVVLFGYKGIQRRHAVGLLMQSGLSELEAKARIQSIARGTKLPAFANAYQMAGITDGSVIMSADKMLSLIHI